MNRYILIHRLRAPAVLLLIGVLALLDQMGVIEHFWHLFIPLLFILIGVLLLVERAVLAVDGPYTPPYPGGPYAGTPYAGTAAPGAGQTQPSTAIVSSHTDEFGDFHGGQS